MKKLANIALTALIATTAIVGTTRGAQAEYQQCGKIAGMNVCAIDRDYIDSLTIDWTDGDWTHIAVRCGTGRWELSGYNPGRSTVNTIVSNWCF
jgi:hypothetical protein